MFPNPSSHTLLPCTKVQPAPSSTSRPPGPRTTGVGAASAAVMIERKVMAENFILGCDETGSWIVGRLVVGG